jgi:hypothetical protein
MAAVREHPIETARRALLDAALIEDRHWSDLCERFAGLLPARSSLPAVTETPDNVVSITRRH